MPKGKLTASPHAVPNDTTRKHTWGSKFEDIQRPPGIEDQEVKGLDPEGTQMYPPVPASLNQTTVKKWLQEIRSGRVRLSRETIAKLDIALLAEAELKLKKDPAEKLKVQALIRRLMQSNIHGFTQEQQWERQFLQNEELLKNQRRILALGQEVKVRQLAKKTQ